MNPHAHSHAGHGHAHVQEAGRTPFITALAITVAYATVELAAGLWAGSLALASDAGHMFSDGLALGLAAAAAWLARQPPGVRHTYGLGRAEVIGASLNGFLMLAIIVILVVEAVQLLLDPRPVNAVIVMAVAAIGLAVNAGVAFVLSRGQHTLNVRGALLHVIGDLLSSVAALIAGAVIYATGWLLIDPILSIVIALLILGSTLRLLRDTLHVLMEGVPANFDLTEIGQALASLDGVITVHDLHVWSIGSDRAALSAHVDVLRMDDWPRVLHAAQKLLRERFDVHHVTLQPELASAARRPREAKVTLWPRGERPT